MYPFAKIEKKWQKKWLQKKVYEPDLKCAKKPFYNLMMFPYPSAEGLHVGNMYAFTGTDVYGRLKRMQGNDVFEPIGLDGFGIHSENYAIKVGKHPVKQAKISEKNFYRQLQMIGNGFAWNEHLETYDPEYYKWTQWIFVQMFKHGLAYRKKANVNWCPSCKTVLADEQVIDGKCERCSSGVFKKELEQWFFKITKYAERLLNNLDHIDWSERVKIAQRNWIGKSEGALITFQLVDILGQKEGKHSIEIFTTRPDTLYGATFMVISPERGKLWLDIGWQASERVQKYITEALKRRSLPESEKAREKTGVFSGVSAINSASKDKIPVWISDYVLGDVGTGAIMAVPAHDERDFEFAKKFKLAIVPVIKPPFTDNGSNNGYEKLILDLVDLSEKNKKRFVVSGGWAVEISFKDRIRNHKDLDICVDYNDVDWWKQELIKKFFRLRETGTQKDSRYMVTLTGEDGLTVDIFGIGVDENGILFDMERGRRDSWQISEEEGIIGQSFKGERVRCISPKLSKWLRYENNEKDSIDLAFLGEGSWTGTGVLFNSGKFNGMDSGKAKLEIAKFVGGKKQVRYRLRDWLISRQRYWGPPIPMIFCKVCAAAGNGERKDMPGWYAVPEKQLPVKLPYVKNFRPTGTDKSPLASVKKFYKVRCPKCRSWARRETDVSDTFLDSAWYYLRYPSIKEKTRAWNPFITKKWFPVNIYIGGAEHSVLHLLYVRFLAMVFKDLKLVHFEEPFPKFRAHGLIIKNGAKMSKSKGNVVNPDEYIENFGADALRMYLMFLGPYEEGGDFRDTGIHGITRFLRRVWDFADRVKFSKKNDESVEKSIHKTVKKVTGDIENLGYNTAISALMILMNEFEKNSLVVTKEQFKTFLKLLAPFAPHITEELWSSLGGKGFIHQEKWPRYDRDLLKENTFELLIQVDGKLRAKIMVSAGITENKAKELAFTNPTVMRYISNMGIKKIIFVPNRLINIVT